MNRKSIRAFVLLLLSALMLFQPVAPALADEIPNIIQDAHIVSTTIDVHSRLPTAVVALTCVDASPYVRIRMTLTQKVAGATSWARAVSRILRCGQA